MFSSKTQSHIIDLEDYKIVGDKPINRGAFGFIYLIENKTSKQRFAAKIITTSSSIQRGILVSREISILIRVQSPTIIRFYGFSPQDFGGYPNVTLLMEYKENGSLKRFIELEFKRAAPHEYDDTAKQIILCGIAHGMMTLHSRRVLHRDLKPDNVLLDSNYHPCITDFGLSKFLDPSNSGNQSMSECGTPAYTAPEIFKGNHYGLKSDVYSFGILMYEVLVGEQAYREELNSKHYNQYQFRQKIIEGQRPKLNDQIKPSFQSLLVQCWSEDPKDRPSFQELFTKLSLSVADDDETIEGTIFRIISDQKEKVEEGYNSRYCLENVDVDSFCDYVEEITETGNETQTKRIIELEQQNQQYKQEIELLKRQLKESNNKPINKTIDELTSIEVCKEKGESSNPLEGLTIEQMKKTIQNNKLKEITIPSSVTSIEDFAFSDCNTLTQVTIPSSVASIGHNPFCRCKNLENIFLESTEHFVFIDRVLFTKDLRTLIFCLMKKKWRI